jgi:hypothetical protein
MKPQKTRKGAGSTAVSAANRHIAELDNSISALTADIRGKVDKWLRFTDKNADEALAELAQPPAPAPQRGEGIVEAYVGDLVKWRTPGGAIGEGEITGRIPNHRDHQGRWAARAC